VDGARTVTSFVADMLSVIAERGRNLVSWTFEGDSQRTVAELAEALLSEKGEASSIALAEELLSKYERLERSEREAFFLLLAKKFGVDEARAAAVARAFLEDPSRENALRLHLDTEPRRQELFRRLNHAPGGTRKLVRMRRDLLGLVTENSELKAVDADFHHLFASWFNRGFLVLQRITWATPATILEKIIDYEAVHEIDSWDELRRRIQPPDRRCYAFFHPALTDDPLIFVEVALTNGIAHSVTEVLADNREPIDKRKSDCAVFYSISNCQAGLRGVSFGNFLIKQVVEELARELPQIKTFVTLSPIPGFMEWLGRKMAEDSAGLSDDMRAELSELSEGKLPESGKLDDALQEHLAVLAAEYLVNAKTPAGKPLDPVARFHLGNGARIEQLNCAADLSPKALAQSAGMMVNYLYEPGAIVTNHQRYASENHVAISSAISLLLKKTSSFSELST